jgi:DnaK suppressor protein
MPDTTPRHAELRNLLLDHRTSLERDVQTRLRAGRAERPSEGRDDMQQSDDNISGHLTFSMLQLKSETLAHIDVALARLDAGHYGACAMCSRPIPSRRLRALPFAVHCQPCAERQERRNVATATSSRFEPSSESGGRPQA